MYRPQIQYHWILVLATMKPENTMRNRMDRPANARAVFCIGRVKHWRP